MPQGGRQPPLRKKAAPPQAAAQAQAQHKPGKTGDTDKEWQRSSGAFSGSAKKEYLKWKRQQKAARGGDSSSDEEPAQQRRSQRQQVGHMHGSPERQQEASASHVQHQHAQQLQRAPPDVKDAAEPLRYRPLAAVPAAPFSMAAVPAASTSTVPVTPLEGAGSTATVGVSSVISTVSSTQQQGEGSAVAYMPRLDPAEVGFIPEGFMLDMPTRPKWQGVVNSAEELHALEETEFAAWQAALAAKAQQLAAEEGTASHQQQLTQELTQVEAQQHVPAQLHQGLAAGPGTISNYEGRLEYWRQLWRTLEISTVICMIVDARNPLLHFSHALYRHITQDHKLPLILLLNKCDLLPAAAAAAWQQWLQQHLPGVTVIPVSAAKEQAAATARAVLSAVLQQQVMCHGQVVPVQELVGLSLDELIQESVQRNTHAKRHLEALQQQQQQQQAHAQEGLSDTAAAAAAAAASSEDYADWSTKPNRGARKAGRRAGRRKGQHQYQQQMYSSASDLASLASEADEASCSDAEQPTVAAAAAAGVLGEGLGAPGQHQGAGQQELDEALEELTLERRLSSTSASNTGTPCPAAAEAAAGGVGGQQEGGKGAQPRHQPVVVGMLGEPNVGKSSTLNALLGTHRVAVSSHPGRTKHYQTHYMCDSLVLVDCPGIVFPRLNVSPAMQVLFGSSPIASCRQPYAVLRYLAEASWPRLQDQLKLHAHLATVQQQQQPGFKDHIQLGTQHQQQLANSSTNAVPPSSDSTGDGNGVVSVAVVLEGRTDSRGWSPWTLCEALAVKRHWVLPRSGRLDTYRAANWLLRAALAGQHGIGLAFFPPSDSAGSADADACAGADV